MAKEKKKLLHRIVAGLFLGGVSIWLIIWGVLPFALEVLFLALVGLSEFYSLAERKGVRPSRIVGFSAVFSLLILAVANKEEYVSALMVGFVMIAMLGYLFRRGFHVSSFLDVGVTVVGFIYLGWFFCYIIFLRKIGGPPFYVFGLPIDRGAGFVLLLIFANHFADIGAFAVGKLMGKHKLAPHISPNKTVEGAIGGILGSIGGAFLMGGLLGIHWADLVTVGLLCGLFALLGDLWESVLKRDVNVKDAGVLIAGHGGVIDRFDSLLFSTPIFYFYIKYFYLS